MPEYSHIQTYIKCNKETFQQSVKEFVHVISPLGFNVFQLEQDFNELEWEIADNGFMYSGCNSNPQLLNIENVELKVRPLLMGWTPEVIPELKEPWLEICILFETEETVEDYKTGMLRQPMKPLVWRFLTQIASFYSETGTFFTDEVTDGTPWESIMTNNEDIWAFDAAIIPKQLFDKYSEIDQELFYSKIDKEQLLLARKIVWDVAPW